MLDTDFFEEDPVFPETEDGVIRKLDFLGYCPCPIRAEMQRRMHAFFRRHEREFGKVEWFSPAGCFHGGADNDPYDSLWKTGGEDDMPGVQSDGGSCDFFTKHGHERWIGSGVYGSLEKPNKTVRSEFRDAGIDDPLDAMHLYASFPTVILVDRKKLGDRPAPARWEDLQDPIYRGDVTLAGHGGDGIKLSDNLLFNTWNRFGDEGLRALGRNVRQFWAPAKMIKSAGTGNPDGTAIYTINNFFATSRRRAPGVDVIWPEDGAWFQPLMVMAKRGRRPQSRLAIDFLFSDEWGRYIDSVGFPAVFTYPDQKPLPGKLSWVGWDFLRGNDLDALRPELNSIFAETASLPCT